MISNHTAMKSRIAKIAHFLLSLLNSTFCFLIMIPIQEHKGTEFLLSTLFFTLPLSNFSLFCFLESSASGDQSVGPDRMKEQSTSNCNILHEKPVYAICSEA